MKKLLLTIILLSISFVAVKAQNLQVHYDFGSNIYKDKLSYRPNVTTTLEMFKPDKWGDTFFFVDLDYIEEGVYGAYFEIARNLRFWEAPFSVHVEYNGGLVKGFSFKHNYLVGANYVYNNNDYTGGFALNAMYKHIQNNMQPHNFQLTATWYLHFHRGIFTFSGFADFWSEKTNEGNFVFISEPQLWFNLNKLKGVDDEFNLSIGTEVELSNNFAGFDGFCAIPTIAIKWSFN